MCHDISFSATGIEMITDYLPDLVYQHQPGFDFSSSLHVLAQSYREYPVFIYQDGKPHLKYFEWGVLASYMNTPDKIKQYRARMVNARSQKLLYDTNSVWHRLRNQRCLIPITGFFEHRKIYGWTHTVPYHIKLKNRSVFFLLGIYNYAPVPDPYTGEVKGTFTIVTRKANQLMSMIHNHGPNKHSMPVMHQPEKAVAWINPTNTDDDLKKLLEYCIPDAELDVYPVWTIRTTKDRPDGGSKVDPYKWENLPALGNDYGNLQLF